MVVWLEDGNGIRGARMGPSGILLDQTPLIISSGGTDYSAPEVEWNGTHYFVVWSEEAGISGSDVYTARIDTSGVVLDPGGSVVTDSAGEQTNPAIAWNGTNFLVVWEDDHGGTAETIVGALVNPANEASAPFAVSSEWATGYKKPDVASDGTDFLVAWERHWNVTKNIVAALISDNGRVLERDIEIALLFYSLQTAPSVAWTGNDYMVAWEDTRSSGAYSYAPSSIYATRVSTTGEVLDHAGHPLSMGLSTQILPAVASNGEDFFAVWTEEREGKWEDIFGTHLKSGVIEPGHPSIAVSSAPLYDFRPAAAWDGEAYLTVWAYSAGDDSTGIYGARVTPSGVVLDPQTDLSRSGYSENSKFHSDVACLPGSCLVVFSEGSGGALVETDGFALQPQILDLDSALGGGVSSIAAGGDEYLALCSASGFRLSVSGEVIDRIESLSASDSAWSGNGYFVVWIENEEIRGTRVSPHGAILDPGGILISAQGIDVADVRVSWGGMEYLVAWLEGESEAVWTLMVSRVSEDGVVLDAPGLLAAQELDVFSVPAIAGDGSGRWLVGYSRFDWDSEDPGHRVFGRFFSSLTTGVSCSGEEECRSGFCVDGVCCDTACVGQCEACDQEESLGVCSPVTGLPHGQRPACAGTGVCRAVCDGVRPDECAYPGTGTLCAEGFCREGIQYDPSFCDMAGNCQHQGMHQCGTYACGVMGCKTTCTSDRDCAGGFFCIGGSCKEAPEDGCGCNSRYPGSDETWLLVIMLAALAGLGLVRRSPP